MNMGCMYLFKLVFSYFSDNTQKWNSWIIFLIDIFFLPSLGLYHPTFSWPTGFLVRNLLIALWAKGRREEEKDKEQKTYI